MMKIKNAKSPMKNNKSAKARLRGARPVCLPTRFRLTPAPFPAWLGGGAAHLSTE
jgi:hypothetical protein